MGQDKKVISTNEITRIEDSLLNSIGDSQIIDSIADVAEQVLDNFLKDGFIKDIPILGHILKLWRGGKDISSYLFTKKLLRFLGPMSKIPENERQNFLIELSNDLDHRKEVGEHLLLLLERMDDLQKPEILAQIFSHYIEGKISYIEFKELGYAVDHCTVKDILTLQKNIEFQPNRYDEGVGAHVFNFDSNSSASRLSGTGMIINDGRGFVITDIGLTLASIVKINN